MVKTGAHGVGPGLDSGLAMFDLRFVDETEIAISAGDCDLNQNAPIGEVEANNV